MAYSVTLITKERMNGLRQSLKSQKFISAKADIHGICVKLYSTDRTMVDMWESNFHSMSDSIRPHASIILCSDDSRETKVLYETVSHTAFLLNFDYYGWVKSIGLAVASDILEDTYDSISHVHGAVIDTPFGGVTLIAPSKTGKTTHSWGLLRLDGSRLVTDDWYFVKVGSGRPIAYGSEKNCYIDADIGKVWSEFQPLVDSSTFDSKGRAIADIRWVAGDESVIPMTTIKTIILLKRDSNDKNVSIEMTAGDAFEYLKSNNLCNPHQIVTDERKLKIRYDFFKQYLQSASVYMINTTGDPVDTQKAIRNVIQ